VRHPADPVALEREFDAGMRRIAFLSAFRHFRRPRKRRRQDRFRLAEWLFSWLIWTPAKWARPSQVAALPFKVAHRKGTDIVDRLLRRRLNAAPQSVHDTA
jgi:predicted deacetylase